MRRFGKSCKATLNVFWVSNIWNNGMIIYHTNKSTRFQETYIGSICRVTFVPWKLEQVLKFPKLDKEFGKLWKNVLQSRWNKFLESDQWQNIELISKTRIFIIIKTLWGYRKCCFFLIYFLFLGKKFRIEVKRALLIRWGLENRWGVLNGIIYCLQDWK